MLKVKLFNTASQKVWPLIRFIHNKKISRRCSQCINSEYYQPLNQGLCQDCIVYNANQACPQKINQSDQSALKALEKTIQSFCGSGKKGFDALVFFSGGKDSTLLVKNLIQQYPSLRFLAITIDNGIMSPIALENIKVIVDKLGFDHLVYKPNDDVFQRSFKFALEQVKGKGCAQVVDMIDGDLFHDIGFHLAAKMEIPLVLSGLSKEQVEDIILINQFTLPQERLASKRMKSGLLTLNDFVRKSDFDNYWWSPEHYQQLPTVVYPNYVWNYSQEDIVKVLHQQCGLEPARLDPVVTNNLLIPVMGVIDVRQIGYSSFEPEFSKMVRRGKVDRTFWLNVFQFLEYISKSTRLFDKDVQSMFKQLKVDEKEVFYGTKSYKI